MGRCPCETYHDRTEIRPSLVTIRGDERDNLVFAVVEDHERVTRVDAGHIYVILLPGRDQVAADGSDPVRRQLDLPQKVSEVRNQCCLMSPAVNFFEQEHAKQGISLILDCSRIPVVWLKREIRS